MTSARPDESALLYSFRRCPYAIRARMALQYTGTTVRLREVVLRDKPAHMLELSPKGTVPILWLSDGTVIDESLDIMLWALGICDPEGWLPEEGQGRAEVLTLIQRNDGEFKDHLDRYKYASRYEGVDPEEHRVAAEGFLETLEERLHKADFLAGHARGLADAAIAPFVRQFANTDRNRFDQTPFPRLQAWLANQLSSDLFLSVMKKYPPWKPGDSPTFFAGPSAN